MIDMTALKESDIERLQSLEWSRDVKDDVLTGLRDLLTSRQSDKGAVTDHFYMTAHLLDMADVWRKVRADELAAALSKVSFDNLTDFIDGLPSPYAGEVSKQILRLQGGLDQPGSEAKKKKKKTPKGLIKYLFGNKYYGGRLAGSVKRSSWGHKRGHKFAKAVYLEKEKEKKA